jgi:VWFA-related protein
VEPEVILSTVLVALAAAAGPELATAATPTPTAAPFRVNEIVIVPRVEIDARVVDSRGDAIPGLTAKDFVVWVDGVQATIESTEWVAGDRPYAEGLTPEEAMATGGEVAPPGRLIVFFFQTDFVKERLTGLMHMKQRAIDLLRTFKPEDRVAVISYDSHLKLRLDFTNDRDKITAAIHQAILFGEPEPIYPGPFPSLAQWFDVAAARDAAVPEAGLLVTARALRPLPGSKSLAFFGWGLGELHGRVISMNRSYGPARRELALSRTSVFAIDVTDADYHDLEFGLQQVAADTGGFYAKTNIFPGQAMTRLAGAIAGHYLLVVVRPDLARGEHSIAVELVGHEGTVLAKNTFQD